MQSTFSNNSQEVAANNLYSFKDLISLCLRKWVWILSSLILFLALGYLYIKCQEPVYQRSEDILIKDQEAGGGVGGMSSTFASMGLISGNTNVYNELITITSPANIGDVIERLRLDVNYVRSGFFHGTTLYGSNLPFELKFLDLGNEGSAELRCRVNDGKSLVLDKFVSYDKTGEKIKHKEIVKGDLKYSAILNTPVGRIQILENDKYDPTQNEDEANSYELAVSKYDIQTAIEIYSDKIVGNLKEEFADIIELVMKDVSVQRAVAVLSEMVNVYNENWITDKNRIAKATSSFIEDRLRIIEKELGEVDSNLAQQRSNVGSVNLTQKSTTLIEKDAALENQIVSLTNSLSLCNYMLDYLKDTSNAYNIIPVNTGVQSEEVEAQITTYNDMLLARNGLVNNSSDNNPIVKDYDSQLSTLRVAILKGMANRIHQLNSLLASAKKEQSKTQSSLKETPIKTLPLLSEQRQQSVKENLYLFLLEKREENELSQKFTADNIRIITPPMGSLRPVSPKKLFIMAFMFVLGLVIPILILYLRKVSDTKVRSKKDLESVKIPFAGEVPEVGKTKKKKLFDTFRKIKKPKEESAPLTVVQEGERDVVNEAFRVIRSNIDFMRHGKTGKSCDVIMVTSFNPGSGKSFISFNLALSFALKKQKVLVVDCDLRHGSSSMYVGMPGKGLSDYLRDNSVEWRSLIKKSSTTPSIDIIPIGKIPPNPAELLENGNLNQLVAEASESYDLILLDCPPVNIVVDTHIVAQCADRTLFVVRAGLLEKSALTELNEFYSEKKFKNMSVLLNGTATAHSRYYTYGTYQSYNK